MRTARFLLASAALAGGCSNDGPTTTAGGTEPQAASSLARSPGGSVALHEDSRGLLAQARINDADARAVALQRVPGGQIVEADLEEEDGRLLYSYEIRIAGGQRTVEVEIDARTGAVVSEEREEDDDDGPPEREDDDRNR
jgi:hypothetical protein